MSNQINLETPLPATPPSVTSKVIQIIDPQAGTLRESTITTTQSTLPTRINENGGLLGTGRHMTLREAANTSEFPALLRDGLKAILFDTYTATPAVYPDIIFRTDPSSKPAEDYLEGNQFGTLPLVAEGNPYPEVKMDLDRTVRIVNNKRGMIFAITEEMVKFDRVGMIKQMPENLGQAARFTLDSDLFSILTTAGNYARTSADNDIGNNTGATTFSAAGLNTALATIRTMKDRKSGQYLNIMPDTLVVTPALEMAAKQLLLAPALQIPGDGVTTAKVYGTGAGVNPFRGLIGTIIVTPYMGSSYQWLLFQKRGFALMQEVEPLQLLLEEGPRSVVNEGYFIYDRIRYRVRLWYGFGVLNDRMAYYSSASAAPAVG
jgi:Mu-like prophage major head subunit gpT